MPEVVERIQRRKATKLDLKRRLSLRSDDLMSSAFSDLEQDDGGEEKKEG